MSCGPLKAKHHYIAMGAVMSLVHSSAVALIVLGCLLPGGVRAQVNLPGPAPTEADPSSQADSTGSREVDTSANRVNTSRAADDSTAIAAPIGPTSTTETDMSTGLGGTASPSPISAGAATPSPVTPGSETPSPVTPGSATPSPVTPGTATPAPNLVPASGTGLTPPAGSTLTVPSGTMGATGTAGASATFGATGGPARTGP